MSNFGFFDLRLVEPYRVAMDEARSARGGAELLGAAREFPDVGAAIADAAIVVGTTAGTHRELHQRLYRLEQGAQNWRTDPGPLAILFGSEKFGLGNDDLSFCHALWRIPSRQQHGSMNLGQAVAVTLYELIRNDAPPPVRSPRRASQEELRRFESLLMEALAESGYAQSPSTIEKVRRLVSRLEIPPHDASVWQGMMRQILWKLRHNRENDDQGPSNI